VLVHDGYEVDTSSDLGSALARIDRAHYDVIVADLYLFGGEDECLLRVVKGMPRVSHIPFVVLTGWTTEVHRQLAMALGTDYFLALPVRPRELSAVLSSLLGTAGDTAGTRAVGERSQYHSIVNGL
jgi:DNA-binding response OmpR family regulator